MALREPKEPADEREATELEQVVPEEAEEEKEATELDHASPPTRAPGGDETLDLVEIGRLSETQTKAYDYGRRRTRRRQRRIRLASNVVRKWRKRVENLRALRDYLSKKRLALREAVRVAAQKLSTNSLAAGASDDGQHRSVSTVAYAIAAALAVALWRTLDGGFLLALYVSSSATGILAWAIVLMQLISAHVAGVTAKRAQGEAHPGFFLWFEIWLGRVAFVAGIGLGIAVAWVRARAVGGDPLIGVVAGLLEIASFVAMTWLAFGHHLPAKTRHTWAQLKMWWLDRSINAVNNWIRAATVRYDSAVHRLVDLCVDACEVLISVVQSARLRAGTEGSGPFVFPMRFERWRRIARGELPEDLVLPPDPGPPTRADGDSDDGPEQDGPDRH